jgi:segregation and condensation protein B
MAKSLKLIVEALLFASDKPLAAGDIRTILPDADLSDIRSALRVLQYEYEAMGRSFSLKEVAAGYQFRSHAEYGAYILQMLRTTPTRLSRAAMETLSIIAYKQPLLRQDIERFRGVDVGGILKTLLEKDLIRIMGRKDLPGRPLIYGTTKKFLEVFDLKDIKSLPKLKEIKALGSEEFENNLFGEGQPAEGQSEDDGTEQPSDPSLFREDGDTETLNRNDTYETQPTGGKESPEEVSNDETPEKGADKETADDQNEGGIGEENKDRGPLEEGTGEDTADDETSDGKTGEDPAHDESPEVGTDEETVDDEIPDGGTAEETTKTIPDQDEIPSGNTPDPAH